MSENPPPDAGDRAVPGAGDGPSTHRADDRRADPHAFGALAVCAFAILIALLWLDRIAVTRAIVEPRADAAIRALWAPVEAVFGRVPEDTTPTRETIKLVNLFAGFLPACCFYLAACALVLFRLPVNDPRAVRLILAAGLVFRITLVPFPPILETDLHRYVWDGAVTANHVNPYQYAPIEVSNIAKPGQRELYEPRELADLDVLDALRRSPGIQDHFKYINHPKIPTIYPPLAQILFSVAYRIAPGSDVPIKALVALVDCGIVLMVLALLTAFGINRCQVVIYAWCPLVLKEYANTGHYDPLATLMVLVALHLIVRRIPVLPGIALGLGTVAKLFPAVLTVLLAPWLGVLGLVAYAGTVSLCYMPHLGIGMRMFDGLKAFSKGWEFNSGLFTLVERGLERVLGKPVLARLYVSREGDSAWAYMSDQLELDAFFAAKIVCGLIGLAFLGWLIRQPSKDPRAPIQRAFAATAALVLLSPVSDPWYYAWVMPYLALTPAVSWLYLACSMVIYYLYFWPDPWGYLPGARRIEYGPFYMALFVEERERIRTVARSALAGAGAFVRAVLGWLRSGYAPCLNRAALVVEHPGGAWGGGREPPTSEKAHP